VRGSPLFRTLILAISLLMAGFGLNHLIAAKPTTTPVSPKDSAPPGPTSSLNIPFELRLSASADSITLEGADGPQTIDPTRSPITGRIALDPANPTIALAIRWKSAPAPGEYRFAKLVLMPPGRETSTHIFDATGDIDDFIELPIP
jgi:hypothetical protein